MSLRHAFRSIVGTGINSISRPVVRTCRNVRNFSPGPIANIYNLPKSYYYVSLGISSLSLVAGTFKLGYYDEFDADMFILAILTLPYINIIYSLSASAKYLGKKMS
jgi:hypothetical protein